MPKKLPAALLPKLRTALASGKIPENGEPGYDDVMDACGELGYLFDRAWSKPKESAAAMKLKVAPPVLAQVAKCMPQELPKLDDVEARLAWYESPKCEPLAENLDELEERIDEADFATELMEACFRRLLAEPGEFFKS